MDWTVIKTTLETQIRGLLPSPADTHNFEPRWQHGSDGNMAANMATGWKMFLRVQSVTDGAVMRRYTPNETDTGLLDENIVSMRTLVIEFRAEADNFDGGDLWALNVTERVRSGLRLKQVKNEFLAVEMALTGIGPTVDASFTHAQRTVNSASMEMSFNFADCFKLENVDWFDTVLLSSEVTDETGALLPSNFTDTEIKN